MPKDTFYITTPIYYLNDVPHIGHAYTTVAADFVSRYRRLAGQKVFFLTGTDEHGESVLRAAEEQGKDPVSWCDEIVPRWKEVWASLEISYDDFIRTTEERHTKPVQEFFTKLHEKGDIYLGRYEGPYCVSCETFYKPSEVPDGVCPIHERPVESISEDNYFFKLSAYQDRLLQLYEEHPEFVQPEARRNEVLSFVKGGLDDISISRTSFKWGIPIPWDPNHVTYVWVEALQNYTTAVGWGSDPDRFARVWPADYHFIGKDILRQHAVIWPALLIAADLPIPKTVFAHGYLTVGGKKLSKTNLTGIHPDEVLSKFGVDGFRYHFLREGVFGQDGSFSWEALTARYNADLANDLGNLVSRALALVEQNFDSSVPEPSPQDPETEHSQAAALAAKGLRKGVEELDLAGALTSVTDFVKATNHYIDFAAPWNLAKDSTKRDRLGTVLYTACEAIRVISVLLTPAIPSTAGRIRNQLGIAEDIGLLEAELKWGLLKPGTKIARGESLFPRVEIDA